MAGGLFVQGFDLPEAERAGFIQACAGDLEFHRELAALLSRAPTAEASLRRVVAGEPGYSPADPPPRTSAAGSVRSAWSR